VSKWLMSSALVLTSTVAVFGAGQPAKVRMLNKREMQDVAGAGKAIQQGKGAGMTRKEETSEPNASREQRDDERDVIASTAKPVHVNFSDSAFRK